MSFEKEHRTCSEDFVLGHPLPLIALGNMLGLCFQIILDSLLFKWGTSYLHRSYSFYLYVYTN